MPRYYCDYCDTYLTHDAPSVRKQHNAGYKHKGNVRNYYQQYEAQLNQSLIDQKVKEHLGAYRPVAAPYPPLRPGLSMLPNPMGVPGGPQMPPGAFIPGLRPPILPRPMLGPPGYGGAGYGGAPQMHQMVGPPGMPFPGQMNGLQRPPQGGPTMVPGSGGLPPPPNGAQPGMPPSSSGPPMGMPPSSGGPPMYMHSMYPGNVSAPTSGSGDSSTLNAQVSEDSH